MCILYIVYIVCIVYPRSKTRLKTFDSWETAGHHEFHLCPLDYPVAPPRLSNHHNHHHHHRHRHPSSWSSWSSSLLSWFSGLSCRPSTSGCGALNPKSTLKSNLLSVHQVFQHQHQPLTSAEAVSPVLTFQRHRAMGRAAVEAASLPANFK